MTGRPRASLTASRARHGDSRTALTLRAGLDGVAVGSLTVCLPRRMGKERIVVMVPRLGPSHECAETRRAILRQPGSRRTARRGSGARPSSGRAVGPGRGRQAAGRHNGDHGAWLHFGRRGGAPSEFGYPSKFPGREGLVDRQPSAKNGHTRERLIRSRVATEQRRGRTDKIVNACSPSPATEPRLQHLERVVPGCYHCILVGGEIISGP